MRQALAFRPGKLNTAITNATNNNDVVAGLTYTAGDPALGSADEDDNDYTGTDKEILSDDGMAITWKIATSDLGIAAALVHESV